MNDETRPEASNSPSTSPAPDAQPKDARTISFQVPISGGVSQGSPMGASPGSAGVVYGPVTGHIAPAIMQTHWQGPYPPPEAVERFERVQQGSFDRILKMAEQLQAAQIKQSSDALEYQHADVRRAQWLASCGMIASMVGAGASAYFGHDVIAGIFLSVPVMGVVKALVDSARASSQSAIDKHGSGDGKTPAANPTGDAQGPR